MGKGVDEKGHKGDKNSKTPQSISGSPRLRVSTSKIDWQKVRKILVVRLRSIGDTVLSTPSLIALRRFLPNVQIDILLEDWVAPVLDGFEAVDNVLIVSKETTNRIKIARKIRKEKYDVAFNLHGGTTATFIIRASGAKHRVGYKNYQYSFLYNHLLTSASDFWQKDKTHSAEQQLALLGFVGVPIEDKPKSKLTVKEDFKFQISDLKKEKEKDSDHIEVKNKAPRVREKKNEERRAEDKVRIALLHPVAAFDTKRWATENFARIAEFLSEKDFQIVAVATKNEREVLENLKNISEIPIITFDNLSLPEIVALASKSDIFVGNDSGIAHIAASVQTPCVVIFGSSNRDNWRPWTDAPNEMVYEDMSCQPCAGYFCKEFDQPKCILNVEIESVKRAIEQVLAKKN